MRRAFVDTSALVALRDSGDEHHDSAVSWLRERLAGAPVRLVLTNFVLAEMHAFFCREPAVALAYARRIRSDRTFEVVRSSAADEESAWTLLESSRDKTYSFVDALSFTVMHRLRLRDAFAFDDHFRRYGRFQVHP